LSPFNVGEFTVDPALDEVSSPAGTVSLQPQVMELLVYLARRQGEVISIETMIDDVWGGKPMTMGSVYNALNTLRRVFGDDSKDPRYIRNVPRKGYCLIAEVDFGEQAESGTPDQPIPRSPWTMRVTWLVLALLVFLLYRFIPPDDHAVPDQDTPIPEKSIAVLPFADMSPEGDQEWFADGIAEEILVVISGSPDLKVVGRTSSFKFKGQNQDLREIGRLLGVAHILEGSVRRDEEKLKVTAQLINASDGFHIWSREFDVPVEQVFAVQEEIAQSIARELQISIGDRANTTSGLAPELDAHELFLLARHRTRVAGLEDLETAVDYLGRAIAIDPDFARAHAELAFAWYSLSNHHPDKYPRGTYWSWDGIVMEHVEAALALNPDQPDALIVRGMLHMAAGRDDSKHLNLASNDYTRALEIEPNNARAHLWLAGLMRDMGESFQERQQPALRAIELEPLWPWAREFYVRLIADMPVMRRQKWAHIRTLMDQDEAWLESANGSRAYLIAVFSDGRLADYIQTMEQQIRGKVDLFWNTANLPDAWALIGEFEAIFEAVEAEDEWRWRLATSGARPELLDHCPYLDRGLEIDNAIACGKRLLDSGFPNEACEILDEFLPKDNEALHDLYGQEINSRWNPIRMQAACLTISKRQLKAEPHIRLMEDWWRKASEEGAIVSTQLFLIEAEVSVLRDDNEATLEALEGWLESGGRDFTVLFNPVFASLREEPRFLALVERWLDLINAERLKLGLEAVGLNPGSEPGKIPFQIEIPSDWADVD
jgi:TolB-like protein/DNA-binding winged helix-turn-helix (wHTH) protein